MNLLRQTALISMTVILVSATPDVTTFCEQEFLFFFKNMHDEHTIWIGENLYGECSRSNLWQIFMPNDSSVVAKTTEMKRFNDWMWAEKLQLVLDHEEPLKSTNQGDKGCEFQDLGIRIEHPKPNEKLKQLFIQDFTGDCALQWTQAMGLDGIDSPNFKNAKADLLYYYPMGLYFNYEVESTYLFPSSNLLLVFTHHPERCVGGDTMHGFMIFKIRLH